jgi:hypothetical protein
MTQIRNMQILGKLHVPGCPGHQREASRHKYRWDIMPQLGLFYVLLAYFVIVGTGNAVNLTDGLDGLGYRQSPAHRHDANKEYADTRQTSRSRLPRPPARSWGSCGSTPIRLRSLWAMWVRWR